MVSMDDRRMTAAGDELCELFGIAPLAKIVIDYARYSEIELTMHALINNANVIDGKCFGCFNTLPESLRRGNDWVMRLSESNLPDDDEHMLLDMHWSDRHMFSIEFCNDVLTEYKMNISVKDLIPSNGLKIEPIDDDHDVLLLLVRKRYLTKIREKMAEI